MSLLIRDVSSSALNSRTKKRKIVIGRSRVTFLLGDGTLPLRCGLRLYSMINAFPNWINKFIFGVLRRVFLSGWSKDKKKKTCVFGKKPYLLYNLRPSLSMCRHDGRTMTRMNGELDGRMDGRTATVSTWKRGARLNQWIIKFWRCRRSICHSMMTNL